MTSIAIELQQVTVRRGHRALIDALDLRLREGEVLALVGPNGSGKSTALRVMAGALRPDAGQVRYFGRQGVDRQERARLVSYLPQDFRSHWDMTVGDLIALGASRGQPGIWSHGGAVPGELLENLAVSDLLGRRLSSLSGGERSRAAIAAAMAGGPKVLLADEPTASLDIAHQLRALGAIRDAAKSATALVVLHDLNLAARFADRIAVLDQGRLALEGPPETIVASTILDDVFQTRFRRVSCEKMASLLVPWNEPGAC